MRFYFILFVYALAVMGLAISVISYGGQFIGGVEIVDPFEDDCEMNAYELRALEVLDRYEFQKGMDIYEPGWSPGIEPIDMPRITPYFIGD
jgi:hypothetical protein